MCCKAFISANCYRGCELEIKKGKLRWFNYHFLCLTWIFIHYFTGSFGFIMFSFNLFWKLPRFIGFVLVIILKVFRSIIWSFYCLHSERLLIDCIWFSISGNKFEKSLVGTSTSVIWPIHQMPMVRSSSYSSISFTSKFVSVFSAFETNFWTCSTPPWKHWYTRNDNVLFIWTLCSESAYRKQLFINLGRLCIFNP